MNGILTIWRLRPKESFEELVADLSAQLVESASMLAGHLAGYAVQTGPDTMAILNMYQSMSDAEVASHAMALLVLQVMEGHAQIIEQHSGPVHALRPQTRE